MPHSDAVLHAGTLNKYEIRQRFAMLLPLVAELPFEGTHDPGRVCPWQAFRGPQGALIIAAVRRRDG